VRADSQLKKYFPLILCLSYLSKSNFQYTCNLKLFEKIYKTSRHIKIKYKSAITSSRARVYVWQIHRKHSLSPSFPTHYSYFFFTKRETYRYMGAISYHKNARASQSHFSTFEKMNFTNACAHKLHLTQCSRSKIFGRFPPMSVKSGLILFVTS